MKKKLSRLECQNVSNKKKWKEECSNCNTWKYDVHSYDVNNITMLLCPECAKKLKGTPLFNKLKENKNEKKSTALKKCPKENVTRRKKSRSNINEGKKKNGCKNKR